MSGVLDLHCDGFWRGGHPRVPAFELKLCRGNPTHKRALASQVTITTLGPNSTPVLVSPQTVFLDSDGYANVSFVPVTASNVTYRASYAGDAAWLPSTGLLSELGAIDSTTNPNPVTDPDCDPNCYPHRNARP